MKEYKTITINLETWKNLRNVQNYLDKLSFSQIIDLMINNFKEARK